jgi:hypothetical protein
MCWQGILCFTIVLRHNGHKKNDEIQIWCALTMMLHFSARESYLELYIESVFSGRYRLVFLGIYHPDTEGNLGRYISVSFFLAGTPFSLKKGATAPILRKMGALAPFLKQPAPLLRKKGVPAKLVIPTGNTDRQVNLMPAKYRYQKNSW